MNGMKDSGSEVSDSGLKPRSLFIGLRLYHASDNLSEQRQILKVVANLKIGFLQPVREQPYHNLGC